MTRRSSMPDGDVHAAALRRLRRIRGQVEGLERMIAEKRYCVDVLYQIRAVEAALHSLAELILRNHLETCVTAAFGSRDPRDRKAKIEELVRVFDGMRPK